MGIYAVCVGIYNQYQGTYKQVFVNCRTSVKTNSFNWNRFNSNETNKIQSYVEYVPQCLKGTTQLICYMILKLRSAKLLNVKFKQNKIAKIKKRTI